MTDLDQIAEFRPTHIVPQDGLPAWETPDVSRPTVPLDAFLPVQLLSRRGDWGEVLCANGWSAWVDGRLLVSVPQPPPTAGGQPPGRTEDPRPQLERGAQVVERYRRAVADLTAGRTDREAFRRSVRALRAGIVIDGESVWLYDETAGRWMYSDGTSLITYAAVAEPEASPGPRPPETDVAAVRPAAEPESAVGHAPTRVVDAPEPRGE